MTEFKFPVTVDIDGQEGYRFSHCTIEPAGKQWFEKGTKPDQLQHVYSIRAIFIPLIDKSIEALSKNELDDDFMIESVKSSSTIPGHLV